MATNPEDALAANAEAATEAVADVAADTVETGAPATDVAVADASASTIMPDLRIVMGRGRRLFKIPSKDSGFYGSGSNAGIGDDNSARETTPGFQQDKWERGTLMPR